MLDIVIICVGRLDKQYWKLPYQEYLQRLQNNAKVKIHTIDEITVDKNIKVNLKLEHEKINDLLTKHSNYQPFLLDLTGQLISSEDLAQIITKNQNYYQGKLLFIIGSSNGVSQALKNNQKIKKLAFGRITLLHQLAQIILLEQLYRALQIINHKPYHK